MEQKITVPSTAAGNRSFTLKKPEGSNAATQAAAAHGGYVNFGVALTPEGTYAVVKTQKGGVPTRAFTLQLRRGASTTAEGNTLETLATSSGNGTLNFTTWLVPGAPYQLCEVVMPGWNTKLAGDGQLFVPASVTPPNLPNPNVKHMTVCANISVTAGQIPRIFKVDNSPPPGGRGLTIGFWKNWASCKKSGGNQAPGRTPRLCTTKRTWRRSSVQPRSTRVR